MATMKMRGSGVRDDQVSELLVQGEDLQVSAISALTLEKLRDADEFAP